MGGVLLMGMLGLGLRPAEAHLASRTPSLLPAIDAKLDHLLEKLDLLGPVPFPFPGDGVHGQPLRYQDNGDLTVTDLNTRLMWEKKVAGGGACLSALHGVDSRCTSSEANGEWIGAINAEGGTGFAGHHDWRLPNVRELMSIADYALANPSVDAIFGPTAADLYWSSTSSVTPCISSPGVSCGWRVYFFTGSVDAGNVLDAVFVRAVRGGS